MVWAFHMLPARSSWYQLLIIGRFLLQVESKSRAEQVRSIAIQ